MTITTRSIDKSILFGPGEPGERFLLSLFQPITDTNRNLWQTLKNVMRPIGVRNRFLMAMNDDIVILIELFNESISVQMDHIPTTYTKNVIAESNGQKFLSVSVIHKKQWSHFFSLFIFSIRLRVRIWSPERSMHTRHACYFFIFICR